MRVSRQPSLGITLPPIKREAPRKGGVRKAWSDHIWLAVTGTSLEAVETVRHCIDLRIQSNFLNLYSFQMALVSLCLQRRKRWLRWLFLNVNVF